MKKWTLAAFVFAIAFMTAQSPVRADDYNAGDKLGRGLVNILTCPLEIPRNITNMTDEKGPAMGWTAGIGQGLGMTIARAGVGIIETLSFPFDFPGDDKGPIMEPKFAWQDWKQS